MADFELRVVAGTTLGQWLDPPSAAGAPSRVRHHPGVPQLYRLGKVGIGVELRAVVAGVEGPADSTLGGRLFFPFMAEGLSAPPSFYQAAGFSSKVRWVPTYPGHHLIGVRRPYGGAVLIHFDIEA